jgi:hypothetical protein
MIEEGQVQPEVPVWPGTEWARFLPIVTSPQLADGVLHAIGSQLVPREEWVSSPRRR